MMTAQTTQQNYTPDQTAELVQNYQAGTTVEALAEHFGKSVRSIVAKLSREGVYKAKAKGAAKGKATKALMTEMLEDLAGTERGALETLQKGSHEALEALLAAVTTKFN